MAKTRPFSHQPRRVDQLRSVHNVRVVVKRQEGVRGLCCPCCVGQDCCERGFAVQDPTEETYVFFLKRFRSLCLSRACLGKYSSFSMKMAQQKTFPHRPTSRDAPPARVTSEGRISIVETSSADCVCGAIVPSQWAKAGIRMPPSHVEPLACLKQQLLVKQKRYR